MPLDAAHIRSAVERVRETGKPEFGGEYEPGSGGDKNEILMFLKPELTSLETGLAGVCDLINDRFARYEVSIGSEAVLPSTYLKKYGLIAKHYGAINVASTKGLTHVTPETVEVLKQFEVDGVTPDVLGAHQFLERFPQFSPSALATLYDNLESVRLAGGAHGVLVRVDGNPYVLLNGFHPQQLEHFEAYGRVIFCFVCFTPRPWRAIRQELVGATNPARALEGSIRRGLLEQRHALGLSGVNSLTNGIHASAGPVEAGVEISRYLTDHGGSHFIETHETTTAAVLRSFDRAMVDLLFADGTVSLDGRLISAFDATEEVDLQDLPDLVRRIRLP